MAHIILLETDQLIAQNICHFIRRAGHLVEWYVDPQAAVDSADSRQPDMIILDLLLVDHNGIEFLYEFRSYPEWNKVPIVVFSSVSPAELGASVAGLHDLGVTAYHYKPITSLAQLAQTVENTLAHSARSSR